MAIRWDEFPHGKIRLKIYAKLRRNAVEHSAEDSLRHILRRRLQYQSVEDHRRFIELEARNLVEHLRCTRDVYREYVDKHNCRPVLEAHWVVLRCAVFPTALALLRERVIEYAKLSRILGLDLSLLFGTLTRTCYKECGDGLRLICAPDLNDDTPATDEELQSVGKLVNEDTLLWFRDIQAGGAVGRPFGGGPFAVDDAIALRRSFSLCGLRAGIVFPKWMVTREKLWNQCIPWSEGLCNLFGSVQEELLSQWSALPSDSMAHEFEMSEQNSGFGLVVVPPEPQLPPRLEQGKNCQELAEEIGTIKHKRVRSGLTIHEIEKECPSFKIWKRVEVLSADDKDTFLRPGTWEPGYSNLLLGKLYATAKRDVAPGTVNTWRKEYRNYVRWQEKHPSKTADDFILDLKQRKRSYRKPLRAR